MKYDITRAAKRSAEFIRDPKKKGALVFAHFPLHAELPQVDPLSAFDFPREIKRFCDQNVENLARYHELRSVVDDDWLPVIQPYIGVAAHSCFMGGDVVYEGDTSYNRPCLEDITKWESLRYGLYPHYQMLLDAMHYLQEKVSPYGFFTSLRGTDGPMDIANAVRGNDLFYDLYEEPEAVKEFLDYCAEAAEWNIENQRKFASVVEGGYIAGMGHWMPGNSIGHISEDASCLCSPKMYEEFGIPATAKLLGGYDYAVMHVHTLGRKCIPAMSRLPQIKTYQLSDDPKQPAPIEVYREYAEELSGKVVMLSLTAEEVRKHYDFLKERRSIISLSAKDPCEAEDIIAMLR